MSTKQIIIQTRDCVVYEDTSTGMYHNSRCDTPFTTVEEALLNDKHLREAEQAITRSVYT